MTTQKEFEKAGKKPGLQVWRVEKMELVPISPKEHGNFYMGDTYIVLHTDDLLSYDIHLWKGSETSQDEKGAGAILMTQLDDFLNGEPRQFCETQNEESLKFLGYFKKTGIKCKLGGVTSGFKKVVTNEASVKRLLHVKGRRFVRASELPVTWSSFNRGDCFIIDLGKNIYIWSGSESNYIERLKATEVAIDIRDNERSGRAEMEHITEGSEPDTVVQILGPKPDLPPGGSDKQMDKASKNRASLYLISDATGSMTSTMVAEKTPFKQDMLSENECYILDNSEDKKIYIWKGKEANKDERKAAHKVAEKFIKDNNYSPDTPIQILPDGGETSLFKQFFENWLDKYETTGPSTAYTIGSIAKVEQIPFDASKLHTNNAMAAQHAMVDDGSGKVEIWRVEGGDKKPVDPSTYGQFYGGDCYLVLYTYTDEEKTKYIIYTWQGNQCSKDELGASAILTVALDDSMGGRATQVRVTQGEEPQHLVSLFKDKTLVIHKGGTSREHGDSKPASKVLFHIRQSSTKASRAVEVEPTAHNLSTNDVFVLKTTGHTFVWKGKEGTSEEVDAAKYVASLFKTSIQEIDETKEPDDFWEALGGKRDYHTTKILQFTVKEPQLFACSNKTGRLIAEVVPGDLTQNDLLPDDIMIMDTGDQIFLWIGKHANDAEKKGAPKIAEDYLKSDPSGRQGVAITTIKQGEEPITFTGWFHGWDHKFWEKYNF